MEVHVSLMHASSKVIRRSNLTISGFDMSRLEIDASDCRGCRLGKTRRPDHRKSTAPSRGGSRRPWGSGDRKPSTTGYAFFGQRVDTDISIKMPRSWPHNFTCLKPSTEPLSGCAVRRVQQGVHGSCRAEAEG